MTAINLNADMGESYGAWQMGNDDALLRIVRSANIACGFHAGDPMHMAKTVEVAVANGVSLGAHPAFPDLQGFGRRAMHLTAKELSATVMYQVGALQAFAVANGTRLSHVKPHGALNNMACADLDMATVIVQAVRSVDQQLIILAPACSALVQASLDLKVRHAIEIFADRSYQDDGQLTPRAMPNAMVHGAQASVDHVLRMLDAGGIVSQRGVVLHTPIHSICVHGDNPQAIESAASLRDALISKGYVLARLDEMV